MKCEMCGGCWKCEPQSWRFNDRDSKWHLSAELRHHGSAWYKHHTVPRLPVPRPEQKRVVHTNKPLTAAAAAAAAAVRVRWQLLSPSTLLRLSLSLTVTTTLCLCRVCVA